MGMEKLKIIVAAHKPYRMPNDPCYLPVHVGAADKVTHFGYQPDDEGENISGKNPNFCELTGLYWAWKNLEADYIGLVHYRRHFSVKKGSDKFSSIATGEQLSRLLETSDILLPKKRYYYIESNYSQYIHAHHAEDLDITRQILSEKYPEAVPAFDAVMRRTYGHRFNMMVMKRELLDEYCTWLFDVLFTLEERLDIVDYSSYDARVFGFVSERLLDVWMEAYRHTCREVPYIYMEKQNWLKKGSAFLLRKLGLGGHV